MPSFKVSFYIALHVGCSEGQALQEEFVNAHKLFSWNCQPNEVKNFFLVICGGVILSSDVSDFSDGCQYISSWSSSSGCVGFVTDELPLGGFSVSMLVFPVIAILPVFHTHVFIYHRCCILVASESIMNYSWMPTLSSHFGNSRQSCC